MSMFKSTPSGGGAVKNVFATDIKLGERYRDTATGFEGTATSVHFFQHGCERVTLKGINKNGEIVDYAFDAPELEHAKTGVIPTVERRGGPHDRKPPVTR